VRAARELSSLDWRGRGARYGDFMDDPMVVRRGVEVPLSEIKVRTSRSSGPGGQHANVTASRVEAVFDVASSTALTEAQKRRVMDKLGPRVTAVAQDARSQARNRELALERLRKRLRGALAVPRPRRPTAPTAGSRERRLADKRRASQRKRARRPPGSEDE
jgi:ribosome-associated protein